MQARTHVYTHTYIHTHTHESYSHTVTVNHLTLQGQIQMNIDHKSTNCCLHIHVVLPLFLRSFATY